jgi:hypothetical protein
MVGASATKILLSFDGGARDDLVQLGARLPPRLYPCLMGLCPLLIAQDYDLVRWGGALASKIMTSFDEGPRWPPRLRPCLMGGRMVQQDYDL